MTHICVCVYFIGSCNFINTVFESRFRICANAKIHNKISITGTSH